MLRVLISVEYRSYKTAQPRVIYYTILYYIHIIIYFRICSTNRTSIRYQKWRTLLWPSFSWKEPNILSLCRTWASVGRRVRCSGRRSVRFLSPAVFRHRRRLVWKLLLHLQPTRRLHHHPWNETITSYFNIQTMNIADVKNTYRTWSIFIFRLSLWYSDDKIAI